MGIQRGAVAKGEAKVRPKNALQKAARTRPGEPGALENLMNLIMLRGFRAGGGKASAEW